MPLARLSDRTPADPLSRLLEQAAGRLHANLGVAPLVEAALARGEGMLADNGALVVRTGARTGRSPDDKYVVRGAETERDVWWGNVNRPVARDVFDGLLERAVAHLAGRDLFQFDGFAGAAPAHRLPIRVLTDKAWVALFARTLFVRPGAGELAGHAPSFTVVHAGGVPAGGAAAGVRSDTFIGLDLERGVVLIMGTEYAGEVKKSIFSVMNYLLPRRGVLTMHCSANVGARDDAALFFGLSGTGKTTLSADPARSLIGDDETGWSDDGIFNIEGGCYAKCINLSRAAEPQIYDAIRFGSVLENVVVDLATRAPDFSSAAFTENTRATYPVDYIPGARLPAVGPHPRSVIFLTADAFGVLPPVAKLTPPLAMYHYISGYTAKVAGTEAGVTTPKATFSPCFGGPFLPLHPMRYAELLGQKLARHDASCWLVNTGWSGGPYGVGRRMKIEVSRAVVSAILSGALDAAQFTPDPVFRVLVPTTCPGVPSELLSPRGTWADKAAYDAQARQVAELFRTNFEPYAAACTPEVRGAGPLAGV
jgi:phosphoenolpyruvate carboxykinase (ATP)